MRRDIPLRDEPLYRMVETALSQEKIDSMDAAFTGCEKSHLSDGVRRTIIIEITYRALTLLGMEIEAARRDEADIAIENTQTASSLAEAKAKAIWRKRNIG